MSVLRRHSRTERPSRAQRLELREIRDQLGLSLRFAVHLHDHLAAIDDELESAQAATDPATRDEHARQAYWRCQAVAAEASGLAEDAGDFGAALAAAFGAPDPARHADSRWFSEAGSGEAPERA